MENNVEPHRQTLVTKELFYPDEEKLHKCRRVKLPSYII
jgi:hypothetical protein